MPLPDTRRQELDSVVRQMVANHESDQNIQAVVHDFVSKHQAETAPVAPAPRPDLLQRASDTLGTIFPGTKRIGESLVQAGANVKNLVTGGIPKFEANLPQNTVDVPKLAGAYGEAATTAASVAAPLPKAAGTVGAAVKGAGQTAALAAASGGAASLEHGDKPGEVAKNAFVSALTGAAVGAVAGGATKAFSYIGERAPEALYNSALKVTQRLKEAGKSPAAFLADEGAWGSLGTIKKAAQEGIDAESSTIQAKIADHVATAGDTPIFYDTVKQKALDALSKRMGGLYSREELAALIDRVPVAALRDAKAGMGLPELNRLRSDLGMLVGDTKWTQQNPTEITRATQAVYGAMADIVKEATGTKEEFARLSKWLGTDKVVNKAIFKADSKFGLGLYDYATGIPAAILGGTSGDGDVLERAKRAALYGGAAIATERTANSALVKTGIAQLMQHLDALPADAAGRISRTAVAQLIGQVFAGHDQPAQPPQ